MTAREDDFTGAAGSASRPTKQFESDLALDIIEELYPLILENCTDEDDDLDARAILETLAGLCGTFIGDYHEQFGREKALAAWADLVDLTLNVVDERIATADE